MGDCTTVHSPSVRRSLRPNRTPKTARSGCGRSMNRTLVRPQDHLRTAPTSHPSHRMATTTVRTSTRKPRPSRSSTSRPATHTGSMGMVTGLPARHVRNKRKVSGASRTQIPERPRRRSDSNQLYNLFNSFHLLFNSSHVGYPFVI